MTQNLFKPVHNTAIPAGAVDDRMQMLLSSSRDNLRDDNGCILNASSKEIAAKFTNKPPPIASGSTNYDPAVIAVV